MKLISPLCDEVVYTCHEIARDYLMSRKHGIDVLNGETMPLTERDAYAPVVLRWENDTPTAGYTLTYCGGGTERSVSLPADAASYAMHNLFKGTAYEWTLTAAGDSPAVLTGRFYVSDTGPRVAHIDGLTNLRDLGGYTVKDGRLRQGLLYRSAHPDHLTEQGVADNDEYLGIRTQMDLRWGQTYPDNIGPLGAHRHWQVVAVSAYGAIADEETKRLSEGYLRAFRFLTDASRYPIVFHCAGGADRTGTLAFLVDALLGVSYEELVWDYEFTTFSCPDEVHNRRYIDGYVGLASQSLGALMHALGYDCPIKRTRQGEPYYAAPPIDAPQLAARPLQSVVEAFLLDGGITKEEIKAIKSILIE